VLLTLSATAGIIVVFVFVFLVSESLPALQSVAVSRWFTGDWQPAIGQYNLLPMVVGSVAVTGGSAFLATPLGLASALFLTYYAPKPLAGAYRRLLEVLGSLPSVIFGFWGLTVLVPLINSWSPPGQSILAGILILTVMTLPTVALASHAALVSLSPSLMRGAMALGLSRSQAIVRIMLPAARAGIAAAVLLQTGRALGETMVVLMVCGNLVQWPGGVFDPVRTLTANIALEMAYATDTHRSSLFVCALVLFCAGALLVYCMEALKNRHEHTN